MIILRPLHCDVLVSSSETQLRREFLSVVVVASESAGVPSTPLRAGSSLRRAIPRGFVQDDKIGGRRRLSIGLGALDG